MNSFCWGTHGRRLLLELQRSDYLPAYNSEGVRQTLREMMEIVKEMMSSMQAEGFDRSDLTHLSSFLVHHSGFEHNKRCLLAYVRHRMKKVEQLRWEVGRVIPLDVKQNLSTDEQEHFKKYSASLESYMKECGFDLMVNLSPPKEPFVEVRVLESCGEIYTDDGAAVKLEQNTTHYLRRTDVEQLVRQGYLEQTS